MTGGGTWFIIVWLCHAPVTDCTPDIAAVWFSSHAPYFHSRKECREGIPAALKTIPYVAGDTYEPDCWPVQVSG